MRGGKRTGAGRPPEPHLTPDQTRAHAESQRHPGEPWAGLARRLGISRKALDNALRRGVTVRTGERWRAAVTPD